MLLQESKIIGVSMPRTGNQSLCTALGMLGYTVRLGCHDLREIAYHKATIEVAYPIKSIEHHYPNSRYIFTTRDEEPWKQSCRRMLAENNVGPDWPDFWKQPETEWRKLYDKRLKEAQRLCPTLLVLNITDGWKPLCQYLNKPIPDTPFPHTDRWREMEAHIAWAIEQAEDETSKLPQNLLSPPQQPLLHHTSRRCYHFINNLCSRFNIKFIEYGSPHHIITLCAIYHNDWIQAHKINDNLPSGLTADICYCHHERLTALPNLLTALTTNFVIIIDNISEPNEIVRTLGQHKCIISRQWHMTSRPLYGYETWANGLYIGLAHKCSL